MKKPTYRELEERVAELESRPQHQRHETGLREAAQAQAAENASLLEAVLSSLPVGVSILDARGGVLRANDHFREIWAGVAPTATFSDYVQYKAWWADTGRRVEPEEWAATQAIRAGEAVRGQVLRIERFDGTRAFVHNSAAPIRNSEGEIVGAAVAIQDVTAMRQSAEALSRSERMLEETQRMADVGGWEWDTTSNELTWSRQTYRIFGVEAEGFHPTYDFFLASIHPDDRTRLSQAIEGALAGEGTIDVDYRIIRPDGSRRSVHSRGEVSFDSSGRPVRMIGTVLDITERKRAEERASQGQKTLSDLIEQAPFGIYVIDSQFRIAQMNVGSQNGAFRNVRPVIGRDFAEAMRILWPEEVAAGIIAAFRHTLDTGEPYFSPRFTEPRHDVGTIESYEWELRRIRLTDGQWGVVCYYFDSTKLRDAEEALRRSEARWNAAIEDFAEGAIIATEAEQVIYWNPAARRMHGFTTPREGIGPLAETPETFELWTPDGGRLLTLDEWPMRRIKRGETVRDLELRLRRPGQGWEKIVSYSGAMVDTASGERLIFLSVHDLTEQRRAEEDLRELNAQLEQRVADRTAELRVANESLAERAAQLRILAGELTLTEQRERRRMSKVLHDHLQQLLVAAKFRMTILGRAGDDVIRQGAVEVEGLLDEAINSSRSLTAELSPPILHEGGLIAGLEWLVRWFGDKHGLFIELMTEEKVLPLTDDIRVLLFESVRELLFNVVKHAGTRSATVNVRRVDGRLQLVVADKGAGFAPETVPHASVEGGAFGLFSIRERLEFMGGDMEVWSEPGKGSRFVLTVPVAGSESPESGLLEAGKAAGEASVPTIPSKLGTRIAVLLADDHEVMREGLAQLLTQEPDIEIVGQAADGQAAVELAGKLLPDVILMDMSMPKLNGVEATRIIHNSYPDIRIIGLSMFEEPERAQALKDAGAVAYLTKSGPASALLDSIRNTGRNHGVSGVSEE